MRDVIAEEGYAANLEGVPNAIDRMLEGFEAYGIHTTWATVGFLYFPNRDILMRHLPSDRPRYQNREYNLYDYIESHHTLKPAHHFAPEVIKKIAESPNQELATHTFSHYYCLEEGQKRETFRADLQAAIRVAKEQTGRGVESLVFPRNQWNESYLSVLSDLGIACYRGNEKGWVYSAASQEQNLLFKRALKLLDSHINLTGHHTYSLQELAGSKPYNIPSSRFLRPAKEGGIPLLEKLRLERIKRSMSYAAKKGELFHLWWHPHNFGRNVEANIGQLLKILEHYKKLEDQYGMRSLTMGEIASELNEIDSSPGESRMEPQRREER
jgi:peptidoglycan/xylan/chitin deacetylase (PgdA/CDA1 family)